MNKNKELVKNTIIIFIGKACTQFITILLLPLYTKYLISSEFGILLMKSMALVRARSCFRSSRLISSRTLSSSILYWSAMRLISALISSSEASMCSAAATASRARPILTCFSACGMKAARNCSMD